MTRTGIAIDIPGFGLIQVNTILSDYTGTLSRGGRLVPGVRECLTKLSELVDIHIVTSDIFGFAREELTGLPLTLCKLEGERLDLQKRKYGHKLDLRRCAVFGNGNNDKLVLKATKDEGGLAIAIDNGEGCATDALLNSSLFIVGAVNALNLLIEPIACKATLRS